MIRLAELEGESFLETAPVGLLPFTLLMTPPGGITSEMWLQKCVKKVETAAVDTETRGTLFFALSTFGSLVYQPSLIQKHILEEMMQESPFYEIIIQRGIEKSALENCIKNILSVLTKRFPLEDIQPVTNALESIQDLDRLSNLHFSAIDTPSIERFLQEVETSEE